MRAQRPEYPAITFRSMLEAQWSVIFDVLCLPWAFEPVTFDLPSGLYVPDFKIYPEPGDERSFWVEIKGPWPNTREFEVATEVNIYAGMPLMILTGDIPRQPNGGTAWWFGERQWHMLRPEEALIRVIYRNTEHFPEDLGELWKLALDEARHAELIKVGK
jgi:hypothetical protein